MSLEIDIKNAIHEICMDKYRENRIPVHALFREIVKKVDAPTEHIRSCLDSMAESGKLWQGRTAQENCYKNVPKQ